MSGYVELGEILQNEQIGADVWKMVVKAPKQAAEADIGMFANLRVTGSTAPLLRRPISYAGYDRDMGTVDFLYRVVGSGTELMTRLKRGDTIDTLGPLGSVFHMTNHMLLVGGGVGIAPMLCIAAKRQPGQKITVILGFRDKSESFWADLFAPYGVDVHITTDDGSMGTKGFPTAIMDTLIKNAENSGNPFSQVYTCGPTPMMKGVAKAAEELSVPCEVSLEERMGCGTGGCLGCGCDGKDGKRYRVCLNGPVFAAEEVFF